MPTRRPPHQDANEAPDGERTPTPLAFVGRSVAEQPPSERPCVPLAPGSDRPLGDGEPADESAEPWADPNVEQFLRISAQVLRRKQINRSVNGEEGQ